MNCLAGMENKVVDFRASAERIRGEQLSDQERVHRNVRGALHGRCELERIAQAQARAWRLVQAGMPINTACERGIVWALNAIDGTNPSGPRAA